jgi:DNA-binding response OmpR family regulator
MKPSLLIVDDDIAITQQLYWALCDYFEVQTANDVQSAMRRIVVYEPSIAILDLNLSNINDSAESGLRVLAYMRERLPESRVLMISSLVDRETRDACLANGAEAVLSKPFDTRELITTLLNEIPCIAAPAAI